MNGPEGHVSLRQVLFAGIFVLALGMRIADLGVAPLGDSEAREALWAAEGTPEDSVFWPQDVSAASSAAYQALTWGIFQLAGGGEASARVFPAVIGAFIVFPPWLLRRRLGNLGARKSVV